MFTVRRISYGEGVERVFPVNSPNIEKIEIERESEPMRARLYYLRHRTGKAAVAIKEKERRVVDEGGARPPLRWPLRLPDRPLTCHGACPTPILLAKAANEARGLAIDAVHACNSGHLGLPLGCAEIGAVLYGHALVAQSRRIRAGSTATASSSPPATAACFSTPGCT